MKCFCCFFFSLNFTMENLDVSCPAYDHFKQCLADLCQMTNDRIQFTSEQIDTAFPQYFQYNRTKYLVRMLLVVFKTSFCLFNKELYSSPSWLFQVQHLDLQNWFCCQSTVQYNIQWNLYFTCLYFR